MIPKNSLFTIIFLFFLVFSVFSSEELYNYIKKVEPNLHYNASIPPTQINNTNILYYRIPLTSLTFNGKNWEHVIQCVKIIGREENEAFLFIQTEEEKKSEKDELNRLITFSNETNTLSCTITQVPNEPVHFDGENRRGLSILAYTWVSYLDKKDVNKLYHFPMTKAAITAITVIQEFSNLDDFFVSGDGIMNGITTFLVAAADDRVKAIFPTRVELKIRDFFLNVWKSLCYWPDFLKTFEESNFLYELDTDNIYDLMHKIDPYYYMGDLNVTKYLIQDPYDEFFLTLSSEDYFSEFVGESRIFYSLEGVNDKVISIYVRAEVEKRRNLTEQVNPDYYIPFLEWKVIKQKGDESLTMNITTDNSTCEFTLVEIFNPEHDDFRMSELNGFINDGKIKKYYQSHVKPKELTIKESKGYFSVRFVTTECYGNGIKVSTDIRKLPNDPCGEPPSSRWGNLFNWIVLGGMCLMILVFAFICLICFCVYTVKARAIKEFRAYQKTGSLLPTYSILRTNEEDIYDELFEKKKKGKINVKDDDDEEEESKNEDEDEEDEEKKETGVVIINDFIPDEDEDEEEEEEEEEEEGEDKEFEIEI